MSQPLRNELPQYEKHPFSQAFCEYLSQVPNSLSNMAVDGLLSRQVVRLITKIPRTNAITEGGSRKPSVFSNYAELSDILTDLLRLVTLKTTEIEHLLCHALVAYCLSLQSGQVLGLVHTPTVQDCAAALVQYRPDGTEVDCLVWAAVVIAASFTMSTDPAIGPPDFLDQILNRFSAGRKASTVVTILQSFLWHDDLAAHWQKTWEAAMSRRGCRSPASPSQTSPSTKMSLDSILIKDGNR
jgi:hypothetical protein